MNAVETPAYRGKTTKAKYDAVVVGAGPNGLAAAITLARAGLSTLVVEAAETAGGGMRTKPLTLPGFMHDVCSAVHPMAIDSAFFRSVSLEKYGLEWIFPPLALAHPLPDGSAALLSRSVAETAVSLGADGASYEKLMKPLLGNWEAIKESVFAPLRFPHHPLALLRFGYLAARSGRGLASSRFRGEQAKGLFGGIAAHSMLPLDKSPSAAAGLILALCAHAVGWPLPRGGAQAITNALVACYRELGGEIITGWKVDSLDELPEARTVLCDITPRQLISIAGEKLPRGYRRLLSRYRYGPGVFKVDYALRGPVPWKNPDCSRASTVHLGGRLEELVLSEKEVGEGRLPEKPYVLVTQPSLFDPSRAPAGYHVLWAYCHVPNGFKGDALERLEDQIERFAPGFKELVLARHVMDPEHMEEYNANYVGGDINGGIQDWGQLFTRPVISLNPYATPVQGLYLCSSSTPPGGGVHGMCGYWAARAALAQLGVAPTSSGKLPGKK